MPSISKSNGTWRVRIRRRGMPNMSKVFNSKSDAQTWAFRTESSVELGFLSPDHDCLLKTLLERYRREITPTKHGATQEICRINKLCRHPITMIRLSNLTSNDIAKFRDERLKTVSGTTVVKDLLLISHAIKTAQQEWGFKLATNPVDNVRKPPVNKPRDRRLEEGEEDRLFQSCKEYS